MHASFVPSISPSLPSTPLPELWGWQKSGREHRGLGAAEAVWPNVNTHRPCSIRVEPAPTNPPLLDLNRYEDHGREGKAE
jgi:hypothetical protein